MDPNELADAKAQIKRTIAHQLAALPQQAQADVLADLRLAITSGELGRVNGASHAAAAKTPSVPAGRRAVRRRTGTGTFTGAVHAALKASPRAPIADLAKTVYGADPDGIRKLRQVIFSLKKQGRAKRVGPAQWEAIG
jgi:hypothetical protein